MKVIKRYGNRKLYDMGESSYITLTEITELVKSGIDIQVVDNKTKNDITSQTLFQAVYHLEMNRPNKASLETLVLMLQARSFDDLLHGSTTTTCDLVGAAV